MEIRSPREPMRIQFTKLEHSEYVREAVGFRNEKYKVSGIQGVIIPPLFSWMQTEIIINGLCLFYSNCSNKITYFVHLNEAG